MIPFTVEDIQQIENTFGSPAYVFDEAAFIQNYLDFQRIMRQYYSKYQISYSYKTNYTPYICACIKKLGGYAEVVSEMEYEVAKKIGYDDHKIIVNGPNKEVGRIKKFSNGCLVNVDNLDELELIYLEAKKNADKQYKIGLRVNIDVGQGFVSRFGMDFSTIRKAFEFISSVPNLKIIGLHCHISRCRGIEAWKRRTEIMLSLADQFFKESVPEYIDLGSGMFGKMDLEFAAQFNDVPSYEDYAKVTAGLVEEHYNNIPEQMKPVLFTEPGTTIINKYVDFIGRVSAIKSVQGKTFAIVNFSEHNLGEVCTLKKLPCRIIPAGGFQKEYDSVDIVGYTCLEQDLMYKGYSGKLSKGDYVQFGNVGGYSNVYKPPFIEPNCVMLAKTEKGEYIIMKRKEKFEDVFNSYVLGEK